MRNFLKKTSFFKHITFSRSSKRPKRKYQQKSFLKHQLTYLDFFKNYALRFHLGVSRLFGHIECIYKLFYAG
jgi:hypothetical protein